MTPDYKLYGEKIFRLKPDKPRRNAREIHGLQGFWQTDRENYFKLGDAPPDRPNMRIVEIESDLEIENNAYEQRVQCEGILDDSSWIETGYEEDLPEEGWDTINLNVYTRDAAAERWRKGSRIETDAIYGVSGAAATSKLSKAEHGLITGQVVMPEFSAGFSGLTSGGDYFIYRLNANQFYLCPSKACALVAGVTAPAAPAAVTGSASTHRVAWVAHGLSDGDVVTFVTLIGGYLLVTKTPYYVINATADDFQLAATAGGAAINFSSNITAATIQAGSASTFTTDGASMRVRPIKPGFESCWITERRKRKARAKDYWELDLQLKGLKQEEDDSKPVKRRINTTGQTVTNDAYGGITISGQYLGFPPQLIGSVGFSPPDLLGPPIAAEFDLPQISVTDTMITTTAPPTELVPGYWVPDDAPTITVFSPSSDDYTYHCPSGWKVLSLQSEQIPGKPLWLLSITWGYQLYTSPRTAPAA